MIGEVMYSDDMERDAYFMWLCDQVKGSFYENLLWVMYKTPFEACISIDSRIVQNGLVLREGNYVWDRIEGPCSVLEALLGLAKRLDDIVMYEIRYGDRSIDWFWMFVDNLGFSSFTNSNWDESTERVISERLEKFVYRDYNSDGSNWGLFVIEGHEDKDLRDVGLWTQTMWWVDQGLRYGLID